MSSPRPSPDSDESMRMSRRKHILTMKIPFCDVDMAGIVYTPRFADYIVRGWEEYFRSIGTPWEQFAGGDVIKGLPVISMSIRFKSPARCGDILDITTKVSKLTKRRIYFRFTLFNNVENRMVAVGTLVVTAFDGAYKPTPIPDFIVSAITGKTQ